MWISFHSCMPIPACGRNGSSQFEGRGGAAVALDCASLQSRRPCSFTQALPLSCLQRPLPYRLSLYSTSRESKRMKLERLFRERQTVPSEQYKDGEFSLTRGCQSAYDMYLGFHCRVGLGITAARVGCFFCPPSLSDKSTHVLNFERRVSAFDDERN